MDAQLNWTPCWFGRIVRETPVSRRKLQSSNRGRGAQWIGAQWIGAQWIGAQWVGVAVVCFSFFGCEAKHREELAAPISSSTDSSSRGSSARGIGGGEDTRPSHASDEGQASGEGQAAPIERVALPEIDAERISQVEDDVRTTMVRELQSIDGNLEIENVKIEPIGGTLERAKPVPGVSGRGFEFTFESPKPEAPTPESAPDEGGSKATGMSKSRRTAPPEPETKAVRVKPHSPKEKSNEEIIAQFLRSMRSRNASSERTESSEWTPIFQGVERRTLRTDSPRRMVGHALRIDVKAPGIRFLTTPSNGSKPGETDGLKTSSFLRKYRLQAAVNAAPFSPIWHSEERPQDIKGLGVSNGEVVSHSTRYPAILITKNNEVRIKNPPFDLSDVHNAVCGFDMILKDGRTLHSGSDVHPRVCAGVSKDGRYFFLLVVDGRQYGYSLGATRGDLAAWLKLLGAWDGINLDGGGTATMVVQSKRGFPELVNKPIHNGRPGNERIAGSHLGVFARAISKKSSAPAASETESTLDRGE